MRSARHVEVHGDRPIDLNADLGEECGDDAAMLAIVTSANVAAGAHAGGGAVLETTVAEARRRGVVVGAHVSYPDREGFGRTALSLTPAALRATVYDQLVAVAAVAGPAMRYVKAHGALYNVMADDEKVAATVLDVVRTFDGDLAVLTLPGGAAERQADRCGLRVVTEGFADRAYTPDGRLVSRSQPGAVVHERAEVVRRALLLADGRVETVDGSVLDLPVESICLHGDTPGAVTLARAVRAGLVAAGRTVQPFAR